MASNIYDAACWQIAIAVAAYAGKKSPTGESLYAFANNVNKRIVLSSKHQSSNEKLMAHLRITAQGLLLHSHAYSYQNDYT